MLPCPDGEKIESMVQANTARKTSASFTLDQEKTYGQVKTEPITA